MLDSRNFLVPDATLVIELIAFVVVLAVMTRYVLPRIRAAMRAREHAISQAMTSAREAEHRRHAADTEARTILAEARRDAGALTARARSVHGRQIAAGNQAGVEEYRWLAGRAQRELHRRTELAQTQAQRKARTAAVAAARTYLGADVDAVRLEQLVDEQFDAGRAKSTPTRRGHNAATA